MITFAGGDTLRGLLERVGGKLPPDIRVEVRRALVAAGRPMLAEAKANASWSQRIPDAITLRTRLAGKKPGLTIRVDAGRVPHARPYEGITRSGTFRHPVFGRHSERWVSQATRPFLRPAAEAHMPRVRDAIAAAVTDVLVRL